MHFYVRQQQTVEQLSLFECIHVPCSLMHPLQQILPCSTFSLITRGSVMLQMDKVEEEPKAYFTDCTFSFLCNCLISIILICHCVAQLAAPRRGPQRGHFLLRVYSLEVTSIHVNGLHRTEPHVRNGCGSNSRPIAFRSARCFSYGSNEFGQATILTFMFHTKQLTIILLARI